MLPSKDDLESSYRLATEEPYQFLYVNLRATDVNDMFFIGFSKRIRVNTGSKGKLILTAIVHATDLSARCRVTCPGLQKQSS